MGIDNSGTSAFSVSIQIDQIGHGRNFFFTVSELAEYISAYDSWLFTKGMALEYENYTMLRGALVFAAAGSVALLWAASQSPSQQETICICKIVSKFLTCDYFTTVRAVTKIVFSFSVSDQRMTIWVILIRRPFNLGIRIGSRNRQFLLYIDTRSFGGRFFLLLGRLSFLPFLEGGAVGYGLGSPFISSHPYVVLNLQWILGNSHIGCTERVRIIKDLSPYISYYGFGSFRLFSMVSWTRNGTIPVNWKGKKEYRQYVIQKFVFSKSVFEELFLPYLICSN